MHNVQRVLRRQHVVHASPDATVYETARDMAERRVGAMAVVDGERLVGIFSERDLMTRVVVPGRDPHAVRVSEVMTRDVVTAGLGDNRETAIDKMKKAGCRHLPVVTEGRVIGMISMRDLLRDEIDEQRDEIRNLRAYLYQQPPA
jgi:CBS domain-containing protein